jgi:hypothetical protein
VYVPNWQSAKNTLDEIFEAMSVECTTYVSQSPVHKPTRPDFLATVFDRCLTEFDAPPENTKTVI